MPARRPQHQLAQHMALDDVAFHPVTTQTCRSMTHSYRWLKINRKCLSRSGVRTLLCMAGTGDKSPGMQQMLANESSVPHT